MTISPCRVPIAQGDEDRQDGKAREREAGEGCPGFEQGHHSGPGQQGQDEKKKESAFRTVVTPCSPAPAVFLLVCAPLLAPLVVFQVFPGLRPAWCVWAQGSRFLGKFCSSSRAGERVRTVEFELCDRQARCPRHCPVLFHKPRRCLTHVPCPRSRKPPPLKP